MPALRRRAVYKKSQRIRVLIAGDYPVFRYGLRMLLQSDPDMQVVGETAEGAEAVKLVLGSLRPDILLLDLANQSVMGTQMLRQIARSHPGLRTILMLTTQAERQEVIDVLQLGVRGMVMKTASAQTIVKSIRTVMAGKYWIPQGSIRDLVRVINGGPQVVSRRERTHNLTPRELEIVIAVATGCTNKDLAQRFAISEDTVKHHLTSVFGKSQQFERLGFGQIWL